MDFSEAMEYVRNHGVAMLTAEGSNLNAVAVSCKNGGPITESKDFCVAAYVDRKLSKDEMNHRDFDDPGYPPRSV